MRELIRTTDVVLASAVEALLGEADIPCRIFDRDISVLEGSINVFPLRVVVAEDRYDEARVLLHSSGLVPPDRHDA